MAGQAQHLRRRAGRAGPRPALLPGRRTESKRSGHLSSAGVHANSACRPGCPAYAAVDVYALGWQAQYVPPSECL